MKTSVLIIAHNEEKYIARCIESVLQQTQKPDEIVLMLHNSTDRTKDIAEKYPITLVPFDGRSGIASVRIEGLNHVSGEKILCIDGDSFAQDNWVEAMTSTLISANMLVGSWVKFKGTFFGNVLNIFSRFLSASKGEAAINWLWGPSMAFWKKDYEKIQDILEKSVELSKEFNLSRNPDDYWLAFFLNKDGVLEITNKTYVTQYTKETSSWRFVKRTMENVRNVIKISTSLKNNSDVKKEQARMDEFQHFGVGIFSSEEVKEKTGFIKSIMATRTIPEYPYISVVVPAFKEEKYILATLLSLARQTYQNCEFIIVANGEPEGNQTQKIAEACGFRVINDPLGGISRARQTGLVAALGKVVVTTDADTIHHSRWLERISMIMADTNIRCGAGLWRTTSKVPSVRRVFAFIAWTHRMKNAIDPKLITGVSEAASFYRREPALACGGYDPAVIVSEGVMMFRKFWKSNVPIIYTDEELVVITSGRRQEEEGAMRWFLTGAYNAILQTIGKKGVSQSSYPDIR